MTESFIIVTCLQVTVTKTTVNIRQQFHLVAHVVFAPPVQLLQHLSGLLQTFLVMAISLG